MMAAQSEKEMKEWIEAFKVRAYIYSMQAHIHVCGCAFEAHTCADLHLRHMTPLM